MSKKKVQKRLAIKGETSIDVPTDTIFFILTRLPVKSLLRFKSVSKAWNAIICDDEFTKIHHHQTKALGRKKLLVQRPTGYFNFRDLENPQLILMERQLFPLKRLQQCAEIMCSCDGLVLIKDHKSYNEYVLWNPSTTKYRVLELCPYLNLDNECPKACGLCNDSNLDDYKVIVICKLFYVVYSLNKGCWKRKQVSLVHFYQLLVIAIGGLALKVVYFGL
uniref:F-box protein At2g02030 n=1 Tax=Nicotiana sylvestris TaxID=4096 RepID=A0A1U7Z1H1_NICSY|nr:PREDICTED: putative F-box protein At2g02030 [Nicotiana sylvestris]